MNTNNNSKIQNNYKQQYYQSTASDSDNLNLHLNIKNTFNKDNNYEQCNKDNNMISSLDYKVSNPSSSLIMSSLLDLDNNS